MSTLMSGDMNISRPSTRVRTAPGGASTITFGDPTSTTVKAAAIPAAPVASAAAVDEITDSLKKIKILSVPSSSKIVGLALATSVGAEEITLAVGKALAAKGVRNVVVSLVHSATILPYVAKQMAAKCDVILAVGVLETDTANLSQILTTALIETGLRVNCPIIPGMLAPGSLLETKAALSVCLPGWIKSILSLVALGVVHPCLISDLQTVEVVVAAPAVTEAAVEVQAGAGGRVDGQARPSTAPASNSRRAPGGASTLVLG